MNMVGTAYTTATNDDLAQIDLIANRYVGDDPLPGRAIAAALDVLLAHHACPMDLPAFAQASDYEFYREIVQIRSALNRQTGKLVNYQPRFAREVAA